MKLEQLASLLKKDASELSSTLNLEISADVPDEKLTTILTEHIKLIEVSSLSEGKKQGEGKAKREVLSQAEKLLKEKFEVDGNNFDEIVEALTGKVGKVEIKADEKVIKERDAWKAKAEQAIAEKENLKKSFERIEVLSEVKQKLNPIIGKFEFPTEKVKEIAFEQFTKDKEFLISEGSIFIMQDGKPVGTFETLAENHFKDFGKPIQSGSGAPPNRQSGSSTSFGTTTKELMQSLRQAKTPEERSTILQQLKALETN